jgi:Ca2+-dependent lipid-binding protein
LWQLSYHSSFIKDEFPKVYFLAFLQGFNPYWNEEFQFQVKNPEMALVRFAVYDKDVGSKDDFIAQFSLPFTSMKQGKITKIISKFIV